MTTFTVTADDIEAHRPDVLLPPDEEFAERYALDVEDGRSFASERSVALVAICRNAMPWLPQTLKLIEETGEMFGSWRAFIFENDSTDGTKDVLAEWSDGERRNVSLNINHRPHLSHTIDTERTIALAEYRSECQKWVRNIDPVDYVIVFDADAWGGWSVDGLATSVAHMEMGCGAAALASYSWAEVNTTGGRLPIHYDAFAARLNHWRRRDQTWFHYWHPAVGSEPIQFNSAFGQLALYRAQSYLAMEYSGEDCEHVCAHRTMPGRLYLNPSSRCVSFWVPTHGGQHGGD
jgi:hypothetical protein